jgi:hypothetical protein
MKGNKSASDEVVRYCLSARFGWTPDQIRAMRLQDIYDYLELKEIEDKINKK